MCCEEADEEQLRYEAELFNCETCPIAKARDEVWPENLDAWRIWQRLASRVVTELELGPETFRRLTEDRSPDDVSALLERMAVIHEWVVPRRKEKA